MKDEQRIKAIKAQHIRPAHKDTRCFSVGTNLCHFSTGRRVGSGPSVTQEPLIFPRAFISITVSMVEPSQGCQPTEYKYSPLMLKAKVWIEQHASP